MANMNESIRLGMLFFDMKSCTNVESTTRSIMNNIATQYHDNPADFRADCEELETMRMAAIFCPHDLTGLICLKRYFNQLKSLQFKFIFQDVRFSWYDPYENTAYSRENIQFELSCIAFNIAALHSILGTMELRNSVDSTKSACSHFQHAAYGFQLFFSGIPSFMPSMSYNLMQFMYNMMLGQAQQCVYEKSISDNGKSSVNAKLACQISEYYKSAFEFLKQNGESGIGTKLFKDWGNWAEMRYKFYLVLTYYHAGLAAEDDKNHGESVGYLNAAVEDLNGVIKLAKNDKEAKTLINQVSSVITKKRDTVKKDNDFVYNAKVVPRNELPPISAANVVRALDFSASDPQNVSTELFKRLIPLEAHKLSSVYSEEKAKKLRKILESCESKNAEIQKLMSLMNIDPAILSPREHLIPLPDDLLQCCASMNVDSSIIQELTVLMQKLSDGYYNVKDVLETIEEEIKNMEKVFKNNTEFISCKSLYGKLCKAQEDANLSNQALAKNVAIVVPNLKILAGPVKEIREKLDFFSFLEDEENMRRLDSFKKVFMKMEQMMEQRNELVEQLRTQIRNDDITEGLFQIGQNIQELFSKELQKHDELIKYIEQNLSAQEKIIESVKEANVVFAPVRKLILTANDERKSIVKEYVDSFQLSEELKAKAKEGICFFNKLLSNLENLLKRIEDLRKTERKVENAIVSTSKPRLQDVWDVPARQTVPASSSLTASVALNQLNMSRPQSVLENNNLNAQMCSSQYQIPYSNFSFPTNQLFVSKEMSFPNPNQFTSQHPSYVPFISNVNLLPSSSPAPISVSSQPQISHLQPNLPNYTFASTSRPQLLTPQFSNQEILLRPWHQMQTPSSINQTGILDPRVQTQSLPTSLSSNFMYDTLLDDVANLNLKHAVQNSQPVMTNVPTNTSYFNPSNFSLPNPEDVYKPGYYSSFMKAAMGQNPDKK